VKAYRVRDNLDDVADAVDDGRIAGINEGGVGAHGEGGGGDLVDGLAFDAQGHEYGADLRGSQVAAHDIVHDIGHFDGGEIIAGGDFFEV
jgi:hypothetical protein